MLTYIYLNILCRSKSLNSKSLLLTFNKLCFGSYDSFDWVHLLTKLTLWLGPPPYKAYTLTGSISLRGIHFDWVHLLTSHTLWLGLPPYKAYTNCRHKTKTIGHQLWTCSQFPIFQSVKENFLSNFLYILIIFQWQIHKDDLNKLNLCW